MALPFDPGNGGPQGLFLMQLDGAGRDSLAPGLINNFTTQGFGWSLRPAASNNRWCR